jgi:hypothetical protein
MFTCVALDANAVENAFRIRRGITGLMMEKLNTNAVLYQMYGGTADVDITTGFFGASRKAWERTLPMFWESWSTGSRNLLSSQMRLYVSEFFLARDLES